MESKDEQKKHLIDMMRLDEEDDIYEEPNQALKDAAERYIVEDNYNRYYNDFTEGAKWQQERSYSEEDMLKSFMAGIKCESNSGKNFEQFIKQFKKK